MSKCERAAGFEIHTCVPLLPCTVCELASLLNLEPFDSCAIDSRAVTAALGHVGLHGTDEMGPLISQG